MNCLLRLELLWHHQDYKVLHFQDQSGNIMLLNAFMKTQSRRSFTITLPVDLAPQIRRTGACVAGRLTTRRFEKQWENPMPAYHLSSPVWSFEYRGHRPAKSSLYRLMQQVQGSVKHQLFDDAPITPTSTEKISLRCGTGCCVPLSKLSMYVYIYISGSVFVDSIDGIIDIESITC